MDLQYPYLKKRIKLVGGTFSVTIGKIYHVYYKNAYKLTVGKCGSSIYGYALNTNTEIFYTKFYYDYGISVDTVVVYLAEIERSTELFLLQKIIPEVCNGKLRPDEKDSIEIYIRHVDSQAALCKVAKSASDLVISFRQPEGKSYKTLNECGVKSIGIVETLTIEKGGDSTDGSNEN